ncbi:FAD-dependent monooxygenase, partial [Microbacterium arthrosphaerae]
MRAAIIGAGIGGLCTAIGLARAGADVTVFERAEVLKPRGSGLSIFGNGLAALDALGAGDAVRAISGSGATASRAGQRTPDGSWLATIPAAGVGELRIVHRADLHEQLVALLPPGALRLGVAVTAVADGGRRVEFADASGTAAGEFGLTVAADGLRSAVRRSWPGDRGIRYSGYSTWRGVTDRPVDLRGEAGETWGRGLRFGLAPLADGRVYWFGVATMPEGAAIDDEFGEVRRLFGHWHAPIPELLDATDPEGVFRLPIHDLAGPLPTFRQERCVLLGDAAHAMTPDLGQGAGQAMEDAATLAALLAPFVRAGTAPTAGIDDALAEYDRLRRARTQPLARRARMLGRVAQARSAVGSGLRDA